MWHYTWNGKKINSGSLDILQDFQQLIFFFISTIGVPSRMSSPETLMRVSWIDSTVSSDIAMGFGLTGLRVAKTPRSPLDLSPLG